MMIVGISIFVALTLFQWYLLWGENCTRWGKGEKLTFFVVTLLQTIFIASFSTYIVIN